MEYPAHHKFHTFDVPLFGSRQGYCFFQMSDLRDCHAMPGASDRIAMLSLTPTSVRGCKVYDMPVASERSAMLSLLPASVRGCRVYINSICDLCRGDIVCRMAHIIFCICVTRVVKVVERSLIMTPLFSIPGEQATLLVLKIVAGRGYLATGKLGPVQSVTEDFDCHLSPKGHEWWLPFHYQSVPAFLIDVSAVSQGDTTLCDDQ